MFDLPDGLKEKFERAAEILRSHDKFRVITHYDADGISAAAVLSRALIKAQKGFHISFVHSFPDEIQEGLPLIFSDVGNAELAKIAEVDEPIIVIDHHKVEKDVGEGRDDHVFINPHDYGIDGAQEVSGGSLAFILALTFDEKNWTKVIFGMAGAAADKQNIGGFKGLNKNIIDSAEEKGVLEKTVDLYIDGDGVKDALMNACDPYFPGVSGRERKIDHIIERLNIDSEAPVDEISKRKKRKLNSLLALSLIERDIPSQVIENIQGPRYTSSNLDFDMDLLYKLLNSCSRSDNPGLGLSLCLGEERSLEKAKEIRKRYRKEMISKLHALEDEGIEQKNNIQYFFEEKKERKGELAGLGMLYIFDQSKPTFGITKLEEDDRADISARATKDLVEVGIDLGRLCNEAAGSIQGRGGGHDIAAGATVPLGSLDVFLDRMDDEIGRRLDTV